MRKLKLLSQYTGVLDPAKVAEGMNAARTNAQRLAADAQLLFDAGRYSSCVGLAILAIEEAGKVSILRELAVVEGADQAATIWKRYRSHTSKNVLWLFPEFVAKGARQIDDFRALFDETSDHTLVLDKVKQVSFYSDCYGQGRWHLPERELDAEFARDMLSISQLLAKGREVTPREIELWVQHMKPMWPRDPGWQRKALANWYSALQAEGLLPPGDGAMDEFLWGPQSGEGSEEEHGV